MMNAVEVKNLCFKYDNRKEYIFKDVNFNVRTGETIAITGRSGSGKTTLCHCICGLVPRLYKGELTGEVLIFGENIKNLSIAEVVTKIGIIFQNPSTQLFSPTIEDELAFGPENLCVEREEINSRIDEILRIIKMEKYRYDNPNNLSGGQQQLIAIASVLMLKPSILICDEIMSWIDDEGRKIIKDLLLKLKKEGKTIILVDHDNDNLNIADRIIHIGE
ncbi:MAG TPA: ABC transporter ATP-binding protein [Sedimentibacter sp.]|jgi:energy-coupling factor transport system ATP-binding protein|nr:ABC transporter ATP-binding protein [Sedimentibacter sp.]HPB78771.1 ABC transporter ATP-binding protein [Sedimentibacter sp.]HQO71503.1 ABC transporter ATP-binding protein [Sedimentibacter sp.]HQO94368.1 ABC transporter ATP-binding protein [Sedimentibacter sp.]